MGGTSCSSYTGGLQGTLADIITSNTTGLADFGNQYLSVRVEYTPSSNQWQMFLRNDGTSAFTDPTTGSALVSQGTAVDSTFTSTSDKNFTGGYWNGSFAANQTAFFDNFYLKVDDPGPSTTPAVVLSPNVSTVSVVEGGATASLSLSFTQLPTSNVTVTITPSNNEVDLGNGAGVARILTFTPTDATTAQSFLITAIDDTIVEGPHDSRAFKVFRVLLFFRSRLVCRDGEVFFTASARMQSWMIARFYQSSSSSLRSRC